jgi:hypothetical protein
VFSVQIGNTWWFNKVDAIAWSARPVDRSPTAGVLPLGDAAIFQMVFLPSNRTNNR